MNLEDLVDEMGLQQDEYSTSGVVFGDDGQLTLTGWSGRQGSNKYYILNCSKCSQDNELFGQGFFRGVRGNLARGQIPCGCAFNPKWSKEQYIVLCSRKAEQLGYSF